MYPLFTPLLFLVQTRPRRLELMRMFRHAARPSNPSAIHPAWYLVSKQAGLPTTTTPFQSQSKNQSETTFAPTGTPPTNEKA